ncbi:hypothetical protein [Bernardetia sp. MNP-M8]|uniref:hypothetical protein n=1 Tax=Bernardetia sp. MNP-M8 TaxID=3127470 RepID=UPI0030D60EF1
MPIQRRDNNFGTLEEFYQKIEKIPHELDFGSRMLLLIDEINKMFVHTDLWAYTSHGTLVIQNIDDIKQEEQLIEICYHYNGTYRINYEMPKHAPWKNAKVHVHGLADGIEEIKKYLLIAMRESEGWKGNEELILLLKKYEL